MKIGRRLPTRSRLRIRQETKSITHLQESPMVALLSVFWERGWKGKEGIARWIQKSSLPKKVNLARVQNRLMQLAEIYLACEMAGPAILGRPRPILMDLSLSGVLMFTDVGRLKRFTCLVLLLERLDSRDTTPL